MHTHPRFSHLILVMVIAALVTACSSAPAATSGASPTNTPAQSGAASPSEALPSAVASAATDGSLQAVLDSGVLRVGLSAGFRPFEFIEGDKIVGLDPELIALVAQELGVTAEITDSEFSGIIPSLLADRFDVIISAITATPARAEQVLFSQPYGEATMQFLVKADRNDLNSANDLEGKVVAGQVGASNQAAIEAWQAEGRSFADTVYFNSFAEATAALADDRVDAVVGILPVVNVFTHENPEFRAFEAFGPKFYLGIPFNPEDVSLCEAVDEIIADTKSDGRLAELQRKWLGFEMPTPQTYPDPVVKTC